MNKYLQILIASGLVLLGSWGIASATSIFIVGQGGTGVNTFTSSQLVYGNGTNALSSVATTTLSGSGVISVTVGAVVIGASPITVSCATCGTGTLTAVTGTYPIQSSGGNTPAISIAFGTTTSNTWAGTQTFTNPLIDGTLSGLIAGNSGTTYAVASSSLFGFTPASNAITITGTYPITGGGDLTANRVLAIAFGTTTTNTWSNLQTFTSGLNFNATSTGTFGVNLTGGCYALGGTCLTAGALGGGTTQAVNWATVAVLSGTPTYANGSSGVGATLTEVGTGALSVDGNSPAVSDRVLVKNQASAFQNGIYTVTATGSGIASYILTRATDYNAPIEITPGINTYVLSGTANTDTTWAVSYTPPLVIGTNNLTYTESAGANQIITLSGAVTGTGTTAITTSFGSQSAGVLATAVTGVPSFVATSTLYGTGTGGQVLMWSNATGGLVFAATSTSASGVTAVTGGWPVISSGGTTPNITWGGIATSSNISAASGILYSTGVNTFASIATSSAIQMSITGNAATVTTNANLSGAVTSSGSNVTSFGTLAQGVLGNAGSAAAVPTAQATSTLYGPAFTALTTYNVGISSTTPAFRFSVNNSGSDFYIDSTGKIVGRDTANGWTARISPTHSFVLGSATTTTWTASTTGTAYSPYLLMPFTGTLRQVRCLTSSTGGLGVNVQVNGSDATPNYFYGSTTAGTISFTAGNTFSVGQKILANFGTTTTSTSQSISCTFDITET